MPSKNSKTTGRPSARALDFWLLGGASIVVWLFLAVAQYGKAEYFFINQRFLQIGAAFSLLTLVCNHPHFMASYALAYGRGSKFCWHHWFCLIFVPVFLIALFCVAYFNLNETSLEASWKINSFFSHLGIGFRFGEAQTVGAEILGISVWLMYFTVGWHYSKQVFGCAMVYANYDAYPLNSNQRRVLKMGLFGVAFYSFCHLIFRWKNYSPFTPHFQFLGLSITELGFPLWLEFVSKIWLFLGAMAIIVFIFIRNYISFKKLPSLNFLVPIVSFFIWWVPLFTQREFYYLIVPFFHSLQYLPFAYRMEIEAKPHKTSFGFRLGLLLLAGFLSFEVIPGFMDMHFSQNNTSTALFFTIAFAVFINVHHFFLDSVLWRFKDSSIRDVLLSPLDHRRV